MVFKASAVKAGAVRAAMGNSGCASSRSTELGAVRQPVRASSRAHPRSALRSGDGLVDAGMGGGAAVLGPLRAELIGEAKAQGGGLGEGDEQRDEGAEGHQSL